MTLPFRRRHNDAEDTHERARALSSRRFLEPLDADDETWLNRHLDACTECRRDDTAYAADRELLRSLRDKPIEPPRDLWAKTSAALDAAAARRSPPAAERRRQLWRAVPVGAVAGVAVLLVVIVAGLVPGTPPLPGLGTPPPVAHASNTFAPGATPIDLPETAAEIPVVRPRPDGSFDLVITNVTSVCPPSDPECAPRPSESSSSTVPLLAAKISTLTLAPGNDQLVYESGGAGGESKILVVPLGSGNPASQPPATPTVGPIATPTAGTGGSSPPSGPPASEGPTPEPTPTGQIEIASGVTLVGEVAYSGDGTWLAFSAAPSDGSAGPDLYVYPIGAATATRVTTDHQTYFSGWLGNRVVASHIDVPPLEPVASPEASSEPPGSGHGNNGNGGNRPSASPGVTPGESPAASPAQPLEGHAVSFVFDPPTSTRIDLPKADVWMPVVDPTSHFIAYWAGSLRSIDGITWQLGDGQVVVDGFTMGAVVPIGSAAAPSSAVEPPTAEPSLAPETSTSPAPNLISLAGHPTAVVTGAVGDFRAKFDPDGTRLAVWVSEHADGSDGRLHLVVIDPASGTIRSDIPQPLVGVPALRRFSIDANRLAWVTPSGQDGHESTLQILGWEGDTFGETESEPGSNLLILR